MKRLSRKGRQREIGGGSPFTLPLKSRFLMPLVYYRLYVTFSLAQFLFGL